MIYTVNDMLDVSASLYPHLYPQEELCLDTMLGIKVIFKENIGGGRNNRVYRILCSDSRQYVAKFYFRHQSDSKDRLDVEFSSLQFLWENGVRYIPKPIAADRKRGCGLYEYIEGEKIQCKELTDLDIHNAVQFLRVLKELTNVKSSRKLYNAAEACFSVQAIVENIIFRFRRLAILQSNGDQQALMHQFLMNDFALAFDEITTWCKVNLRKHGMSLVKEIDDKKKTLSPSDFGFHNALRCNGVGSGDRCNGQLVFLDFEYFGWDDPVKMISDFLLHPAMEIGKERKCQFVQSILGCFKDYEDLAKRLEIVYPLFGLKWCMILLNEFVPGDLSRRRFVGENNFDKSKLQAEQLLKARQMLFKIINEYEHFPYL